MDQPVFFLLSKRFHMLWISQLIGWPVAWAAQAGFEITAEQTTVLAQVIAGAIVWLFGMTFGRRAVTLKPPAGIGKGGATLGAVALALLLAGCAGAAGSKAPPAHVALGESYAAAVNVLATMIEEDRLSGADIALAAATRRVVRQALDRARCADVWARHRALPPPSPLAAEWRWCEAAGYGGVAGQPPGGWADDARAGIRTLRRIIAGREARS